MGRMRKLVPQKVAPLWSDPSRPLNSIPSEEENGSGSGKHCALLRLLTIRAHSPKDEKLPIPSRSMGNPQKLSIYDKMRVQQHRILQFGTRRLRAIISHLAHFRGREGGHSGGRNRGAGAPIRVKEQDRGGSLLLRPPR